MKSTKLPVVEIKFLDHALCSGVDQTPLPITVYGLLVKETKHAYQIACWLTNHAVNSDQNEGFAIVKHNGIKLRIIGYATVVL